MFKKKPNIKNLAPLRSSDRRKITDQIIADYGIEVSKAEPADSADSPANLPANAGITALRSSLLPEGAQSAKFSTTVGADLKTVNGAVYAGTHPGDELRILWIRLENRLVPTVYTLWRHPKLLPLLHTPNIVLEKMRGGADLMTPGLARGPPFPPGAKKGAIVAIAAYENPSVPLVVGECEIDVGALTEVRGQKGHAVKGIHWDGDELWDWGQNGHAGQKAPGHIDGWFGESGNGVENGVAGLTLDDDDDKEVDDDGDGGAPLESTNGHNTHVEGEDIQGMEEVGAKKFTTQEIDDVFWKAFLYSLHEAKRNHRDEKNHGMQLPMPQSLFISHHVVPYLPIFSPEDAAQLQIKKTSWKNAKKFIKALDKAVLVKSKDRNGGETVILDIDFDDQAVTSFVPYRLPKKESAAATTTTSDDSAPGGDSSVGQKLKIVNLYKPKDKLAPIFAASKADLRGFYQASELRPIVNAYLEAEGLQKKGSKNVKIDPVLGNAVFGSDAPLDREILAAGQTPHEPLFRRIVESCCSPHFVLLRNDENESEGPRDWAAGGHKPRSGAPPRVKMLLETRSGNKTATRVSGLEQFFVQPAALAEELQKACASSTSVAQLVGSSPKNPVMEVMVQGPQREAVLRALEKRGVRKEWVEVTDKTKGKKGR